jgi:putative phosphoesterase
MLIGLLSDTHIPDAVLGLPPELNKVFQDVELILHAGDIFTSSVLDELESIAPVLAAQGDSDYADARDDERVREKQVLEVDGLTIWMWHEVLPHHAENEIFPDIIVAGHNHAPWIKNDNGILIVSPGSPTYPDYQVGPGSVGLLNIDSGRAEASIIRLDRV